MDETEFLAREAQAAKDAMRGGVQALVKRCEPHVGPFVSRHPWSSVLGASAAGFLLGSRPLRSLRFALKPLRFLGKAWLEVFAMSKVGEKLGGAGAPSPNGQAASTPPGPVTPAI